MGFICALTVLHIATLLVTMQSMLQLYHNSSSVVLLIFNSMSFSCQEAFLSSMVLGPNIARNAALRENVFMMAVCIQLRIPLFVVGKPGSSKSLAKSIIAESMKGQNSKTDFLKKFKSVRVIMCYVYTYVYELILPWPDSYWNTAAVEWCLAITVVTFVVEYVQAVILIFANSLLQESKGIFTISQFTWYSQFVSFWVKDTW